MRSRAVPALTLVLAVLLSACGPTASPPPANSAPSSAPSVGPTTPSAGAAAATIAGSPAAPAVAVAIAGPFEGEAKTLNGAGATFPAALYSKWFNEYEKIGGVKVNYQSIGSGGGIKSIQDQTVDFGATDSAMTDEQLQKARGGSLVHVPMALGAVVPTYNVPEAGTALKFTPETLAGIYLGTITAWNDPKLVADNPELASVKRDIVTVHRSDGSGTTSIWVDYLSTVSEDWASKVGRGTSVNWPNGLGGKGNEGVAGEVKQNPYAIGYVELIYALQNKLGVGQVKNRAGRFVEPNLDSVSAAAAGAAANIRPDLRASIVDAPGDAAYPISGFTWILAYQAMDDRPRAIALTRLMWWATHDAQKFNADLGYAPVPQDILARGEEKIRSITSGGAPAFPGR